MPVMAAAGVVSGVASVVGGIFGASSANKANKDAKKAQKKQEEHNKKVAKLTNEHNDKLDAADVANYEAMREYSHETSLQNWQRSGEIQDYKYLQTLKEYEKNLGITRDQLALNVTSALHRGLMELETELTGKRKQAGIELAQLNAETSLAKTGVGLNLERIANSISVAEADAEFNNRVMTANMKSFISQTERNIKEIQLKKQVADLNVRESTMLKPERLSYDPVPQLPPERIFVERMEAIPGFVPQAAQQNVWAPLIQGVAQGASTIAGIDPTGFKTLLGRN
jgi:hypothetical protein